MKRVFVCIISFLLVCISVYGQKTIRMEKEGGIYKISCKVNGAPMKMYFDTGASTVSISRATAIYLLDNDLISSQDFRGNAKTTTADGSISDNMVINLKDIEIDGIHLRDVLATVSYSLNAPLLLGQTAIQRLGRISLQGDILTIHTTTSSLNEQNIRRDELDAQLRHLRNSRFSNNDSEYEVLEIIEKIEIYNQLNEFELFCKIMALSNTSKHDEVISSAQTWIDRYAADTDSIDWKMRVYLVAALANAFGESGNREKSMEYLKRCSNYWRQFSDKTGDVYWHHYPFIVSKYCASKNVGGHWEAIRAAKESLIHFLKHDNLSINSINNNRCKNWEYGSIVAILWIGYNRQLMYNRERNNNYVTEHDANLLRISTILAAKVGIDEAINMARNRKWNYIQKLSSTELNLIEIE